MILKGHHVIYNRWMSLGTGGQICVISQTCAIARDIEMATRNVFPRARGRKTPHGCSPSIRLQVSEMQKFRDFIMQGDCH